MTDKTKGIEAAPTPVKVEPPLDSCATCRFYFPDDRAGGRQGLCDAAPPMPVFVPTMDPLTRQEGLSLQAIRAPVGMNHWCGSFKPGEHPVAARERASANQGKKPS